LSASTQFDRGTTILLIEQGIDASLLTHGSTNRPIGEVIQIIEDQREALDGLFAFVNQKNQLTLHYIRTIHQVLLRHQDYVEAAWLHHRFTQIHPFQDGNGRVARCLATLVLLRAGRFPLVVTRDQWGDYIAALEVADAGDLAGLIRLFEQIEKRAYLNAIAI
jgi:prophage maintenance system killer protein